MIRSGQEKTNISIMNEAKTHGSMIIFLLLALSVATVRAETGVGCEGGWVNFTCESPDNKSLPMNRTRIINNKVVVRNLQQEDNGTLCPTPERVEFRIVNCTKPEMKRTVYNKAQTIIKCGRPDSSDKHGQFYFCKETGDFDCKDVLLLNPYGKYSMSQGKNLHVTINDITPEDQGIYWCAEHKHLSDWSFRRVDITVRSDFSELQKEGRIGENIEVSCEYPMGGQKSKLFCKGEDPHKCGHLFTTSIPDRYPEKIKVFEDSENILNVTILDITAEDEGTYWFGSANDTEHRTELEIFCRLELTVDFPDQEPTDPRPEALTYLFIAILCVCVAVLVLLVAVLVLIRNSKRRNDAPPQNNRQEECVYEEVQSPTVRKAVTTVYATADPCKTSLHYEAVDQSRGNTSEPKPSSSHCQYSTVFNKGADTCTIQEAPSEEPQYCNVNTKY